MIDVKTGHLIIDNNHSITPETDLASIETMQLGESQKVRKMGSGWTWVDVKNLKIDGHYLNISFLFHGKRIRGFSFVFQDKPYDLNPGWDSWSRKGEKENLLRFNDWLDERFDGKRKLEWGKFWATYDAKSSSSSVGLRWS